MSRKAIRDAYKDEALWTLAFCAVSEAIDWRDNLVTRHRKTDILTLEILRPILIRLNGWIDRITTNLFASQMLISMLKGEHEQLSIPH